MQDPNKWVYRLTENEINEVLAAVGSLRDKNLEISAIRKKDFVLPLLSEKLDRVLKDVTKGRGFALIRGLPVERLNEKDNRLMYWGLTLHFGAAAPQNMMGELISDVRAIHGDWNKNHHIRGYQTRVHLPFHCDKADLVSLLCLQTAKSGGMSWISSSIAIHNEILDTDTKILKALYEPFYIDHRGEHFDGENPFYISPIFSIHKGQLFTRFGQKYVETAQRFPQVPRLSSEQSTGMALFSELAISERFRLDMQFDRGDLQLLNNHLIVHSRSDYEDWSEPDRRRHLLRMIFLSKEIGESPTHIRSLNTFIKRWGKNPRNSVLETT